VQFGGDLSDPVPRCSSPPFVGRKRELSIFGAALQRARAGIGSMFFLSGEAGVGKTVLAAEFADLARADGAHVLEGRASVRFRDAHPFAVWQQILGDQRNRHHDQQSGLLSSDLAPASMDEARRPPFSDHRTHPELFETTARTLVEHARTRPLVLVLDDLYAADPLSLEGLRIFARELSRFGTVVIGVYRDSEINKFREFADLLVDPLLRDSKRISLEAFDDEETREFVRSRSANPLEEETLENLLRLTEGNPRLLDIALRYELSNQITFGSGKWRGGLLQAEMEAHLEHLSPQAREILRTASLSGVEFRLSSLVHVLDYGPGELLDSLHEAEQSGLLKRAEIPGTYRFRQKLVQETLCAELTGARRARMHKRLGEVLEALHPHDDAFVERIAHHYYEAALLGCADKAVDYCSRAAAHAYQGSRIDDASRFYHMALAALEFQGSNPDAIRELKAKLDSLRRGRMSDGTEPQQPPSSVHPPMARPDRGGIQDSVGCVEASDRTAASDASVAQRASEFAGDTFRKEGDFWTLIFQRRILRLKHSNGLVFIAHLLQHPERDFHVTQLVALLPAARTDDTEAVYISRSEKERLGIHLASDSDFDPLLDATAKAEYRRRIEELREGLKEARAFNDAARAAELEKELEFIGLELSRAVGASGRDRKHRQENERARVNVTNSIRIVTRKIAKEHPSFGRFLRLSIRTGRFCSYHPDPNSTPHWRF
jgi:AAA ATPase domain